MALIHAFYGLQYGLPMKNGWAFPRQISWSFPTPPQTPVPSRQHGDFWSWAAGRLELNNTNVIINVINNDVNH